MQQVNRIVQKSYSFQLVLKKNLLTQNKTKERKESNHRQASLKFSISNIYHPFFHIYTSLYYHLLSLSNDFNSKCLQMSFFFNSSESSASEQQSSSQQQSQNNINSKKQPMASIRQIKQSITPKEQLYNLKNLLPNSNFADFAYNPPIGSQKCQSCGMQFQDNKQLLNHQRKFCINSGYDSLKTLISKQVHNEDRTPTFQRKDRAMKKYGEYSLGNFKPMPILDDTHDGANYFNQPQTGKSAPRKQKTTEFHLDGPQRPRPESKNSFQNSNSQSAFSYRFDIDQFEAGQGKNIHQRKMTNQNQYQNKNQSISPASDLQEMEKQFLIRAKDNPASQKFKQQFSILQKSNASIANIPQDKKISYAKAKLDELQQIQQLYLKNGGQSKQFKKNIDKMVGFYENLLKDCTETEMNGNYPSELSLASRPDTPILKLNSLNERRNQQNGVSKLNMPENRSYVPIRNHNPYSPNPNSHNTYNSSSPRKQNHNNSADLIRENSQTFPVKAALNVNSYGYDHNHAHGDILSKYSAPPHHEQNFIKNSYTQMLEKNQMNYAHMYQMKTMEDILRMKSEDNRRLIEALISSGNKGGETNVQGSKPQHVSEQSENPAHRFANEADTNLPSEDKILKLLQEEEMDEMNLISKLPVALQDEKTSSVMKNTELRYRMEKEILKQKLERLGWRDKVQCKEEEREFKNDDWTGQKRKAIVKNQMGDYLHQFNQEFNRPSQEPPSDWS